MRAVTLSVFLVVGAEAGGDFCCYWPAANKLSSCDNCEEKATDTGGQADCESDSDNTWCPSGSPPPSPTPKPSPSPSGSCASGWTAALWTAYDSYPYCCPDGPNYDPKADKSECDDYSGCKYEGDFAYIDHKSYSWVQKNKIVAFFSTHGDNSFYGGKKMLISVNGIQDEVVVADTCGDDDCDGCCTKGATHDGPKNGFLMDMEGWTVQQIFGSGPPYDVVYNTGTICWKLAPETTNATLV